MPLAQVSLDDKYTLEKGRVFITGIQALVRLPLMQRQRDLAAGLNTGGFISGYRGSPLGGYDSTLWRSKKLLEQHHVKFQPGVNEDLAATAVWGTQQIGIFAGEQPVYDGVFGIWYGKGPGVDRSGDALKHGNLAGTSPNGGVLVLAGDDHGAKSSTTAHQSEQALIAAMIPVLYPGTVQEYLDYGMYGWALSRYSGCWIGMKCMADTVESTATVPVDPDAMQPVEPQDFSMPPDGVHIRWPDGALEQERRLIGIKLKAVQAYHRANKLDRVSHASSQKRLGIVSAGKAWLDVCQALELLGLTAAECERLGVSVYKVAMPWPLEPEGIRAFASGQEELLVIEEKRSLMEEQLARVLYDLPQEQRPRLVGKRDQDGVPLVPEFGELSAVEVAAIIASRLLPMTEDEGVAGAAVRLKSRTDASNKETATVARSPWFCSGCPHNSSTKVPEGSRAMAGIGCHTMAIWMDRNTATYTHMGAEGANWIGQAPFTTTKHVFQNLGDGTYFHSGLMAIRAASAANVNITYKILYNDAVAMTGGQPVEGNLTPWEISRQVHAEGVKQVVVVSDEPDKYPANADWAPGISFRHRDDLDEVQHELREVEGVTVLIYDQTCAAEKRRRRKRGLFPDPPKRVFINELVCEGCGDCGIASNCVSVKPLETEFGRKRQIDQSNCNKDFSCVNGFCPSFVTVHGGEVRKAAKTPAAGAATEVEDPASGLPAPQPAAIDGSYNVLVTGIGGTGVITIGALLGMAAHLEGKSATVLDQTGLAQKNGAVMSHLRLAAEDGALRGARISHGQADLILGCDMVVAAGKDAMATMATGRTRAIINDHVVPIAIFAQMPDMPMGGEGFINLIEQTIGRESVDFVNATKLASGLMGDSIMSNLFMVGFALQKGYLPLSVDSVQRAIELNGVAVDANLRALAWGRLAAADMGRVENAIPKPETAEAEQGPAQDLEGLLAKRVPFLTDYQNVAYAKRYEDLVRKVEAAERAKAPGRQGLAEAAARYLFKLMAYKDEYEVGRLYTDGAFMAKLRAQFDGDYKLNFHLAPPLIARRDPITDLPRKMTFGPWMWVGFKLLAKLKGLRGTAFDIFGRTEERRTERQLIADYEAMLDEIVTGLTADNHDTAVKLAQVPEQIRGFGHVKQRHLAQAKQMEQALLSKFRGGEVMAQAAE